MNKQAFPASLLILSPVLTRAGDPSSSVAGLATTPLADGALVYCQENGFEYQLDRQDSTTIADGVNVIAPLSGPGRWFRRLPAQNTGVLVWRPDGLGDVRTWDEVMAVVSSNTGPTTIYCPQPPSVQFPAPVYVVQPGPPPATPVVWDMKGSQFVAPRGPHDAIQIQIRRGATLLNLARIAGGLRLQASKQAGDPQALTFTTADPSISVVFVVDDGAELKNLGSATDAVLTVPGTGQEYYVVFNQMGTAQADGGYPTVVALAGAVLNVNVLSGGLSLDTFQPPNWIGSDPAANVRWIHDGTMAFPLGFWTGYHPNNAGTNVNQPTGIGGGMGPQAYRPTFQGGGGPSVGCMYFDTDEVPPVPIWWDSTQWVDSAGLPV